MLFYFSRQEAGARGGKPAVGLKLATLVQNLQVRLVIAILSLILMLRPLMFSCCYIFHSECLSVDYLWQVPRCCGQV
jgi:hypothetical protein